MCLSRMHKTTRVSQRLVPHCIVQELKAKAWERGGDGREPLAAPRDQALADSATTADSAWQDADQLPLGRRLGSGL